MLYLMSHLKSFVVIYRYPHLVFSLVGGCLGASCLFFDSNKVRAYTVCTTHYRSRHFFNNSNSNEDIATKFEQEYVRCVRNFLHNEVSPLQISLQYPH